MKKIKAEKAEGILVVPYWPNQAWFPVLFKMLIDIPVLITSRKNLLKLPQYPELVHHMWRKIDIVVSLPLIRFIAESNGISKQAQDILEASWRPSTRKRYAGHVQRFTQYCHQRNVDPFQATIKIGIEYLTKYFHTGVGYSSVNTARSVLSTIIKTENDIPFGELPLVCRFLKGVFNLRPALPKYSTTWDVSVVLKYIKSLKALK